jgi:hypothetical protein
LSTRKGSASNTPRLTRYPTLPDVPQLYCWLATKGLPFRQKDALLDHLGGDAAGPFEQVEDFVSLAAFGATFAFLEVGSPYLKYLSNHVSSS